MWDGQVLIFLVQSPIKKKFPQNRSDSPKIENFSPPKKKTKERLQDHPICNYRKKFPRQKKKQRSDYKATRSKRKLQGETEDKTAQSPLETIATCYGNIGMCYRLKGQVEKAIECTRKSIAVVTRENECSQNTDFCAKGFQNLGRFFTWVILFWPPRAFRIWGGFLVLADTFLATVGVVGD